MRNLALAVSVAVALAIAPSEPASNIAGPTTERPYLNLAMNCPRSGELTIGTKKLCYYDCAGSSVVKEVGATDLCLGSVGG